MADSKHLAVVKAAHIARVEAVKDIQEYIGVLRDESREIRDAQGRINSEEGGEL